MTVAPPDNENGFRQIQSYIDEMPSLPATVTKVLEVCNRPNMSPNDLNRVISLDPVLTGQVLKLINSVYYSRSNRTTSITRAIIILGLHTIKNLVLNSAVLGTFKSESLHVFLDGFWSHSLCVAVTMKTLAEKLNVPESMHEECFVAGLLHDLGKLPLNNLFPEEYAQIMQRAVHKKESLEQAEKMMFGIDHCEVGGMIAAKWHLNDLVTEVLDGHHASEKISGENRQIVMMASLANMYANINGFGTSGDPLRDKEKLTWVLESLGLAWEEVLSLGDVIRSEIEKEKIFLHISGESM